MRPRGWKPRELSDDPQNAGGAKFQIFSPNFFYLNLSKPLVAATAFRYDVVMSTIYSYDEFLVFVAQEFSEIHAKDETTRYGQVFFNCLWEFRPSIANQIRATEHDPFHKDGVHPQTHVHIKELWDAMNEEVLSGGSEEQ